MDDQDTAPEQGAPGRLDRLVSDENAQLKAAVACLAGFVTAASAGGFFWGHLPVVLGLWVGAGALLLCAVFLGWQPAEAPTVAYYENGSGLPVPVPVPAPQPMRQPGPPWDTARRAG